MMSEILLSFIVYPGLLFLVTFSLITQWYRRKIIARIQRRVGPKYVGPYGLLQPFADIAKLFRKEVTIHKHAPVRGLVFIGLIGLFSLVAAILITPLSLTPLRTNYDVFVFLYLTVYASIAILLLGYGTHSVYPGIGSSRYLNLFFLSEPVLAISIISLVELIAPGTYSLGEALSRYLSLSSNGISNVAKIMSYILACLSFGLALFSKLSLKPLDISEAETEIAGGLVSELSGPLLSLYILIHEAELTLMFYIFSSMIIPLPYNGKGLPFLLLSIAKYFAVVGVITVLSYSLGRVKIDQAIKILLRFGLPLSLISLTIAIML
ncbi:MAG: hypothetical protein GU361_06575 [Desulfurococcales archaeon]|jgi:NADH-quinone oxidoreductase subunit H|nr:hypothetical protein [Desulfurococcales archaeon]